ncbi:MAG TPA: undecaprenyl-diphosphate phosphatase [Caulobacteraceae bacterium]|jgi:undecaprenyl-diphosphatase
MTALQAIILAIVQGVTELFPISSLGHAVILPALLGWKNVDENSPDFLPYLVVMHLGTAAALLGYFWRAWVDFATAILVRRGPKAEAERRIFWRVIVATIPAVIVGFFLEKQLRQGFGAPVLAAGFLIANGVMLFAAERLRRGRHDRALARLRWVDAIVIGLAQCLALIPGFSRSGATMAGGYLAGLDHEDAARFSFLTATPVILGAGVLEVPRLLHAHDQLSGVAIVAGMVAGVVGFLSTVLLMRWFRQTEVRAFDPFALYCALAGAGSLAWLLLR